VNLTVRRPGTKDLHVSSEFLIAVLLRVYVFFDVTLCSRFLFIYAWIWRYYFVSKGREPLSLGNNITFHKTGILERHVFPELSI